MGVACVTEATNFIIVLRIVYISRTVSFKVLLYINGITARLLCSFKSTGVKLELSIQFYYNYSEMIAGHS